MWASTAFVKKKKNENVPLNIIFAPFVYDGDILVYYL
jgi:hypothetical protein